MTPDLLIVGAGPAGMSAAVEAAGYGLSVLLLDENLAPGGRIWQGLEARGATDADEAAALALIRRLRASTVDARFGASVWAIEPDLQVFWSENGTARVATPARVLLATGTTERPLPVGGWTLPGVMTVGAAQIALKTAGLVPSGRSFLAGQGPLLLLYATQALAAGGSIAGVIDLSDGFSPIRALTRMSLSAVPEVLKGLAWRRTLDRAGVRFLAASEVRAEGDTALRRVAFRTGAGWVSEEADLLLLHDGVIPSVQMTRAIGCAHEWDAAQQCWRPLADAWGRTSVPGICVAGDGAGIGGAAAAGLSGRLVALDVAHALGRLSVGERDAVAALVRAARGRALAVRPMLDAMFPPLPVRLADDTLVCRCEEVTAGAIRQAVRAGCGGMNQLKAYTRCGMGPCQGRMCGPVAAGVLAAAMGVPVGAVELLRTRFPTKPVGVGELVGLGSCPVDGAAGPG